MAKQRKPKDLDQWQSRSHAANTLRKWANLVERGPENERVKMSLQVRFWPIPEEAEVAKEPTP